MNTFNRRKCSASSSPMTVLAALLFFLSGCKQTPESARLESAEPSTESSSTADQQQSDNERDAKPSPATESRPTVATSKPVVDVAVFGDAALSGEIETVRSAIESGFDVDATDDYGRTALMLASFNGHTPVVQLLLKQGAKLDSRDSGGRTALMFAATGANVKSVEALIAAGAEVNAVDSGERFSALMHAAAEGQLEVVQVLLDNKADKSIRDVDGDTAQDFATKNGHAEVVRRLSK